MKEANDGNFEKLDVMHHLTSGFKSIFTQRGIEGLYQVRQSIGGAGMTEWSGIPALIAFLGPSVTYEGDNSVMAQQSFRFLKKMLKRIIKDSKENPNSTTDFGIFNYLREASKVMQTSTQCSAKKPEDFQDLGLVDLTLKICTTAQVASATAKVAKSKASTKEKTNFLFANDIVTASLCHLKYVAFKFFLEGLETVQDANLRAHLKNLCTLCGLCFIQECMAAGYDQGWFKKGDNMILQEAINQTLLLIRPQAVPLVELFDHSDNTLNSAIGNSYGDIYD